jgi:hypothetical protein
VARDSPRTQLTKQKGRPKAASVSAIQLSHIAARAPLRRRSHDANPRKPISGLDKREGSGAPECDGACDGSGPGPYSVAVVTALNDPLAVFMADNFPDVMAPHHDGADLGTAGV